MSSATRGWSAMFAWGLLVILALEATAPVMSQEACAKFEQLDFLQPYDKAEEKSLVKSYWSDDKDVEVVFAQRGHCAEYKGCTLAETTSLGLCQAFNAIYHCLRGNDHVDSYDPDTLDWPYLLFTNCKGTRCELVMDPDATRCMYSTWRESDPLLKANGTCIAEAGDTLLAERPLNFLRLLQTSHCLLPLAKGSVFMKQIVCRDPDNEPWMRWWFDFPKPLSKKPYSCIVQSRCQSIEDPLDFLCVSEANGEKTLLKAYAEANATGMHGYLAENVDAASAIPANLQDSHAAPHQSLVSIGFLLSSLVLWIFT